MNLVGDRENGYSIKCHGCQRFLDVDIDRKIGEFIYRGGDVFCIFCGVHLGFRKDLEEARKK